MKTRKLITFMLALVSAVCCAFSAVSAYAETSVEPSTAPSVETSTPATTYEADDLWEVGTTSKVVIKVGDNGGINLSIPAGESALYANNVKLNNLKATFAFGSINYTEFVITLTGIKTGDSTVENKIVLTSDGTTVKAKLNDGEAVALTDGATITVETFYEAEGEFNISVNGVVLGASEEMYWPYATMKVANVTSAAALSVTLTELNGETFAKDGDSFSDSVAPTLIYLDKFNTTTVPLFVENTIFFEGVDAVGTITREIAVTPVDESVVIPSGKEKNNDYFVITNTTANNKVLFKVAGEYKVLITVKDSAGKIDEKEIVFTAIAEDTVKPVWDATKTAEYQAKIDEMEITKGTTVQLPMPPVSDNCTAIGSMNYRIQYWAPSATKPSTTTSTTGGVPAFTPSSVGVYQVRIIPVDLCENQADIESCPILSVNVTAVKKPVVTITLNTTQYVGTAIKLTNYTPSDSSYSAIKTLEYFNKSTNEWEVIENVGDSYTPAKTGTYRYTVQIIDKYMNKSEPTLQAGSGKAGGIIEFTVKSASAAPQAKSWIEQNVVSVIFLGIAALCVVGIIVLEVIYKKSQKKDE